MLAHLKAGNPPDLDKIPPALLYDALLPVAIEEARKGAHTALLTTDGFRDSVEMA